MRRKKVRLLFFGLGSLFLLLLSLLFFRKERCEYAHLQLTVLDAYSLHPINDALVILPEADMQGQTNHQGQLSFFGIPLFKNSGQNALLPQTWGECSLLVYKEGYRDYALFHMQLHKNRLRRGPTVYLFPEGEISDGPISVIEAPEDHWVEELLELYRPKK